MARGQDTGNHPNRQVGRDMHTGPQVDILATHSHTEPDQSPAAIKFAKDKAARSGHKVMPLSDQPGFGTKPITLAPWAAKKAGSKVVTRGEVPEDDAGWHGAERTTVKRQNAGRYQRGG